MKFKFKMFLVKTSFFKKLSGVFFISALGSLSGYSAELMKCTSVDDSNVISAQSYHIEITRNEKNTIDLKLTSDDVWTSFTVNLQVEPKILENKLNSKIVRHCSGLTAFDSNQKNKGLLQVAQIQFSIPIVRPSQYLKRPINLVKDKMDIVFEISEKYLFDQNKFFRKNIQFNCDLTSDGQEYLRELFN